MLYREHLATLPALTDTAFDSERDLARSEYRKSGELQAPWLQWAPTKTVADLWRASQERRKDPEHMKGLHRLQKELDDEANKIADAVKNELEIRELAQARSEREIKDARKPIGRRYGRARRRRHV